MKWKIPLFKIYWDEKDVNAVAKAIRAGMCWATGPNIPKFEKMIAEYIGTKYCAVFNSGTSALHAALATHGIKKGDEVIVPSFTFIATANVPLFVGAKPVFADIEEETFGLDPEDVKEKITKKTKAIMPMCYGGLSCKIREIKEIAEDHNLLLIEDAAESFGAKIANKKVGTFGDSAMFSFCQPKVFTTGEGGCIVTDSRAVYEKMKLFRSHGRAETVDYFSTTQHMDYVALGYNFRMANLLAALGISQLKKVDKLIRMRRKNAAYMTKKLSKIKEISIPKPPAGYCHVYQMYTIRVKSGRKERDRLKEYLARKGIMAKVYFDPVHSTHFYKRLGYGNVKLPVTERISSQVLTLPMYPAITKNEMDYVCRKIEEFF